MGLLDRFRRFMYGRYGGRDELSRFLLILYIVIFVIELVTIPLSTFIFVSHIRVICNILSWIIVLFYIFRIFSRNIYARSMENQRFLKLIKPLQGYIKYLILKFKERDSVNALYRCNKCHQIIRVPKGKGKIAIRCPKCNYEFIKHT